MSDWTYLAFFLAALIGLIAITEVIRNWRQWRPEITRKTVHIITGFLVAITPFVFKKPVPLMVIAAVFTIVNFLAVRMNLLKSMHGTKRPTYGTVFYPIAFIILLALLWNVNRLILVTSMLIMAIADAVAAIIGEHIKAPRIYYLSSEKKSFQGSLAMFLTTMLIIVMSFSIFAGLNPIALTFSKILWIALVVGIFTTACEAISAQGSDNLTVPLGAAFSMHYMIHQPTVEGMAFSCALGLAGIVVIVSYKLGFLNSSGAGLTFVLATIIFSLGRWMFSIPILVFFVLSSLLSKMGNKRKKQLLTIFEKSSTRDLGQVLANGGIAGIIVMLHHYFPDNLWFLLYLGALAAVNADTWATEIGVLSKSTPRSIITMQKIPVGTSGGITLLGCTGALVGAMVIGVTGYLSGHHSSSMIGMKDFIVLSISGLLGSMVDSVLGATLQAQYQCPHCRKITEKKQHCLNQVTLFIKGYHWMDNDTVNVLSAVSGVLFVFIGYQLFLS